ncbi:hypothetical protein QJS66_07725 [Kocuria rhizophila]|nr:hypothetical protein QJS66_07725 [Kocuria rhizophila]
MSRRAPASGRRRSRSPYRRPPRAGVRARAAATSVPGERAAAGMRRAARQTPVALGPWVEALENPEDPFPAAGAAPPNAWWCSPDRPVVWHVCRRHEPQAADSLRELLDPRATRRVRAAHARVRGELLCRGVLRGRSPGPEESRSSTAAVTAGVPGTRMCRGRGTHQVLGGRRSARAPSRTLPERAARRAVESGPVEPSLILAQSPPAPGAAEQGRHSA